MQRFWDKVDKNTSNGCWEWLASRDKLGYGRFRFEGENRKASRVAWILTGHELLKDREICHKCDNTGCVNPDHLWLGTHTENMRDSKQKGRAVNPPIHRGPTHHFAVLTDKQITKIKSLYATGEYTYQALGDFYGVSKVSIGNYIKGKFR